MFEKRDLDVLTKELILQADHEIYRADLAVRDCPVLALCSELLHCLHPQELQHYKTLQFDRRRRTYLLGRYTAKQAVALFIGEDKLERIRIDNGVFHQPLVVHPDARNVQVSVTHVDDLAAAIAFPESVPIGIDLERIDSHRQQVLERVLTERELDLVRKLPYSYLPLLTALWTAKESLSKALKTGLLTPLHVYEVDTIAENDKILLIKFSNFKQFEASSLFFRDYVCSVTYPNRIDFPMVAVRTLLGSLDEVARR